MARCPFCDEEIDSVVAFILEENRYNVFYTRHEINQHPEGGYDDLSWDEDDSPVEGSETKATYNCPKCEKTLLVTGEATDSMDRSEIIGFLKGELIAKMSMLPDKVLFVKPDSPHGEMK